MTTHAVIPGVSFDAPSDWLAERVPRIGGLLLMAPNQEAGWQANVFFEVMDDRAPERGLQRAMEELARNLGTRKPSFALRQIRVLRHPTAGEIGRIEYTCRNQDTPLTEWEVLIPLDGTKRLMVMASAATATFSKYEPVFTRIIDSVRSAGK